jgi:hypothetical protein
VSTYSEALEAAARAGVERSEVPTPTVKPAAICSACGFDMSRFQTGWEIACTDCGGLLCEGCCDARKAAHR